MHPEIFNSKQDELIPLVAMFMDDFGLVGGTAIALQIGHRRSIDFDLMTNNKLNQDSIASKIIKSKIIQKTIVDTPEEYSILVNDVKLTFFTYPFSFTFEKSYEAINYPDLLSLSAMKAYALGRRSKWKDYIDLLFIFKQYSLLEVVNKAHEIFGSVFNEKLFREQLAYFDDIDYSEEIDYMPGSEVDDTDVKDILKQIAVS